MNERHAQIQLYPLSSWLNSQATSLSWHLAEINNHVEGITSSISMGSQRQSNNIKSHIWWTQRGFSCYRVELFPSLMKEIALDYLQLKDFLKHECGLYLKQPLMLPQRNHCCVRHRESSYLPLKLDGGWLSLSLEIIDYATLLLY